MNPLRALQHGVYNTLRAVDGDTYRKVLYTGAVTSNVAYCAGLQNTAAVLAAALLIGVPGSIYVAVRNSREINTRDFAARFPESDRKTYRDIYRFAASPFWWGDQPENLTSK